MIPTSCRSKHFQTYAIYKFLDYFWGRSKIIHFCCTLGHQSKGFQIGLSSLNHLKFYKALFTIELNIHEKYGFHFYWTSIINERFQNSKLSWVMVQPATHASPWKAKV